MKIRTARAAMMLGTAGAALAAITALGVAPASAAAVSSPTAPAKSTVAASANRVGVHPNTVVFGNGGVYYLYVQWTHIRSGAGLQYPVIWTGMPGKLFLAKYETSYYYSGYRWLEGVDIASGTTGWVAAEVVQYDGPCNCPNG